MGFALSVVIPVYNEETRIIDSLEKVYKYLEQNNYDFELIIVNDGATDRTPELVQQFLKHHSKCSMIGYSKNKGKGFAVKTGILRATKEYVLFSDADLSTPIEELSLFEEYIDRYNIIIGSRKTIGSNIVIQQPIYRRLPGQVFPFLVKAFGLSKINDTQCGFKLFRKDLAVKFFSKQTIHRFGFDVEIMFLAEKQGHVVKELPVQWKNALNSTLNPITDSFSMFKDLIKVKVNDFQGKYD